MGLGDVRNTLYNRDGEGGVENRNTSTGQDGLRNLKDRTRYIKEETTKHFRQRNRVLRGRRLSDIGLSTQSGGGSTQGGVEVGYETVSA